MATPFSMRNLLRALPTPPPTAARPSLHHRTLHPAPPRAHARALATTPRLARMAKKAKPAAPTSKKQVEATAAAKLAVRKRRAAAAAKLDPKVAALFAFLYAPSQTPAPLRMGRNRHLRHWTVHRAWQLHLRRRREAHHAELTRLQQSMTAACEALRELPGPGLRPAGWLFRQSMHKPGLWGVGAVPIEYARPLVETPGEQPWNHEWKREWVRG